MPVDLSGARPRKGLNTGKGLSLAQERGEHLVGRALFLVSIPQRSSNLGGVSTGGWGALMHAAKSHRKVQPAVRGLQLWKGPHCADSPHRWRNCPKEGQNLLMPVPGFQAQVLSCRPLWFPTNQTTH